MHTGFPTKGVGTQRTRKPVLRGEDGYIGRISEKKISDLKFQRKNYPQRAQSRERRTETVVYAQD